MNKKFCFILFFYKIAKKLRIYTLKPLRGSATNMVQL